MGNAWTRLVQEASKHGGPLAMRQHYANLGANANKNAGMKGFAIGVGTVVFSIGASWLATKAVDRVNAKKAAPETGASAPPDAAPDGSAVADPT